MANQTEKSPVPFHNFVHPYVENSPPPYILSQPATCSNIRRKKIFWVAFIIFVVCLLITPIIILTLMKLKNNYDVSILTRIILMMETADTTQPTLTINNDTSMLRTSTINPVTTEFNQSCYVAECRAIIIAYLSRRWAYNTENLLECDGCGSASYPDFPTDWLNRWYIEDIYISPSARQDCLGSPVFGNLKNCQIACLRDTTCVGFTRGKNASDNDSNAQCWLKNNIESNQIINNPTWHTVVFNTIW